jgi:hypothetical protein
VEVVATDAAGRRSRAFPFTPDPGQEYLRAYAPVDIRISTADGSPLALCDPQGSPL